MTTAQELATTYEALEEAKRQAWNRGDRATIDDCFKRMRQIRIQVNGGEPALLKAFDKELSQLREHRLRVIRGVVNPEPFGPEPDEEEEDWDKEVYG